MTERIARCLEMEEKKKRLKCRKESKKIKTWLVKDKRERGREGLNVEKREGRRKMV